jgi:hypothetical protein
LRPFVPSGGDVLSLAGRSFRSISAASGSYPTQAEFAAAGYSGLGATIAKREGHRQCAERLGLAPSVRSLSHYAGAPDPAS